MSTVSASLSSTSLVAAGGGFSAARREPEAGNSTTSSGARATTPASAARRQLSPDEQRTVQQLQQVDRAVRAHEQAHLAAGRGVVTSGARFEYTYGPDGKQYAIGGEVGIDTSPARQPQANIDKGRLIQAAALAPKDPSPQDYRVAAVGGQLVSQGQTDLVREQQAQRNLDAQKAQADQDAARKQQEASTPTATLAIEATPTQAPAESRSANADNAIRLDTPVSVPAANAASATPVVNLATAATAPGNGINDITRQRLAATYTAGSALATPAISVFA